MIATQTDDRRRVVMPPGLPAKSPVTIQQVDADTWIVKRQREDQHIAIIVVPIIETLPRDLEWEKTESRIVARNNRRVAPFEE